MYVPALHVNLLHGFGHCWKFAYFNAALDTQTSEPLARLQKACIVTLHVKNSRGPKEEHDVEGGREERRGEQHSEAQGPLAASPWQFFPQ